MFHGFEDERGIRKMSIPEHMSEAEARASILEMTAEYCRRFHVRSPWSPGARIAYAGRVYDEAEMVNLVDSSLEFWLTAGRYAGRFEKELAKRLGVDRCALVNSGSSANLLAFMALTSPELGDRAVRPGDEVITVAAGFPTTVAPIVQYGAVPVFIDVAIPQYNVDASLLDQALSPKVKAVMLAHTLGNPFDIEKVTAFCRKHDLWLIEDNCDALGSLYALNGEERMTGGFGDIGTSSFYPPHHITLGEGGAVYTGNPLLAKIIFSLRDWGRDCICPPGQDNCCGRRFEGRHGELPVGYDHKYVYSHFGYNLKATDMQAAVGVAQLEKLDTFIRARRRNFARLRALLESAGDELILPDACPGSTPAWFGFPLTLRDRRPGRREAVVRRIENSGVQTRTLFCGNIVRQPCFDRMRASGSGYRVAGSLENTDRIMRDTFWVGVYPGMTDAMTDAVGAAVLHSVRTS